LMLMAGPVFFFSFGLGDTIAQLRLAHNWRPPIRLSAIN
jgi:hypothetical protein